MVAAYLLMVAVNVLANALPIGGMTTGEVSDAYSNLFAPAPVTFSVWGLIYLLLAGFVVYQLTPSWRRSERLSPRSRRRIRMLFAVSCVANAAWIIAWHHMLIPVTMVLMAVLLLSLLFIRLTVGRLPLPAPETLLVAIPFGVYLGWITVATIANATVMLVGLGWGGLRLSQAFWTVAVLLVGVAITVMSVWRLRDPAWGLVALWAYGGILLRHVSERGLGGEYPAVVYTTVACMAVTIAALLSVLRSLLRSDRAEGAAGRPEGSR